MRKKLITLVSLLGIATAIGSPVNSMLGANGAETLAPMEFTASDYVMDGLIRQLDSIETTGYGEYNYAVGTRLRNLATGANSGMIVGEHAEYDGEKLLLGKSLMNAVFPNDDVSPLVSAFENDHWTLEFHGKLIYWKNSDGLYGCVGLYDKDQAFTLCGLSRRSGNEASVEYRVGRTNSVFYGIPFVDGLVTYTLVRNGDTAYFYYNGQLVGSLALKHSGDVPFYTKFYMYNGQEFGSYRFYDRALSPLEVEYNHLVDTMRFGL